MRISPYKPSTEKDILIGIATKRVTLLVEGRNAWHSTWIRRYRGDAAMFTNQSSARDAAERRRKQGSVFYVFDTPALLLFGVRTTCIATDIHPENPFHGFKGFRQPTPAQVKMGNHVATFGWRGIVPGISMSTAFRTVGAHESLWERRNPDEYSFIRGTVGDGREVTDLDEGDLHSISSFAQGSEYRLGWRKREQHYSTTGTYKVADTWYDQLRAIPDVMRLMRDVWETSDHGVRSPVKRSPDESRERLAEVLTNHAVSTYGEVARLW
jgi:hypothetical protein